MHSGKQSNIDDPFTNISKQKLLKFYSHQSTYTSVTSPNLGIKRDNYRQKTSQTHIRKTSSPNNQLSPASTSLIQKNIRPLSHIQKPKFINYNRDSSMKNLFYENYCKLSKKYKKVLSSENPLSNKEEEQNISSFDLYMNSEKKDKCRLSGYGPNLVKSPCSTFQDEVLEKIKQKHEKVLLRCENVKKELGIRKKEEKMTMKYDLQMFMTILKRFHEKNYEKFMLLPQIESDRFMNFLEISDFVMKIFLSFHENIKNLRQVVKSQAEEIVELRETYHNFKMQSNESIRNYIEKMQEQNKKEFNRMKISYTNFDFFSNFENARLEKEFNELQKGLEAQMEIDEINMEFQNFKSLSSIQLKEKAQALYHKEELINKYAYHLNSLKISMIKIENDLKLAKEEIKDLSSKNSQLVGQIEGLNSKVVKYREIALMQKEDTEANQARQFKLIKTVKYLNDKLSDAKKKLGQNIETIGYNYDTNTLIKDIFLFNDLSSVMTQKYARNLAKNFLTQEDYETFFKKKTTGNDPTDDHTSRPTTIISEKTRISEFEEALQQIVLPRYQYNKPNFLSLVENSSKLFDKTNKLILREGFDAKISTKFMATLRGILDSKYNEFHYYQDYKNYSRFPEFVYSWLNNFEISEGKRLVMEICFEKSSDPNEVCLEFISNLYHPLSCKLWECQNFKEFLEEKASSDELFFFLHCRFLLNRGATLQKDGAAFTYTHYVQFFYAELVVELVLKHFDEDTKKFVKMRLKERAKGKNQKFFIDVSFVLKILIEYYRLERKQKLQTMRDLFKIILIQKSGFSPSNKKYSLSDFETFKKIIEKIDPKISEIEKAEFFRECWNISNGDITPEITFTVLTESNYFIQTLKLRSFMNLSINRLTEKLGSSQTKGLMKKDFYTEKLDTYNERLISSNKRDVLLGTLKRQIMEMGVERVLTNYDFMARLFTDKYLFIDLAEFCGKGPDLILNRLSRMFNDIRAVKVFNGHCYDDENTKEWDIFMMNMEAFENRITDEKMQDIEKNKKVKKLQTFIKRKTSKWSLLMVGLINRLRHKNST